MLQKVLVNNFEWIEHTSQFNEDFIKKYNGKSDEGYFLEVDVQYLKNLNNLPNDLSFLVDKMKIKKVEKLVANLHDKAKYGIHITNLKQALNNGLVLKTLHRTIKLIKILG